MPAQLTWHKSMNVVKVLRRRFKKCFGTFIMLLVEGSSETGLFRHLSNHIFGVRNFRNTKAIRAIFFTDFFQFNLYFKNEAQNWENLFCFWDNCIWTGTGKLSLVRTGYLSLAANVLTSSTKIFHVHKRDLFQLNWLGSDQWTW